MRHVIFFWRNNEALGLVTSRILLMLYLQYKNQGNHYFFNNNQRFFLIMRHLILFWRNAELLDFFTAEITLAGLLRQQAQVFHYFFRKTWSTSLDLQKKTRCLHISPEKINVFYSEKIMRHLMFSEDIMDARFFHCRSNLSRIIKVTSQSASLFFLKK